MPVQMPGIDDVIRIREWASPTFGGCKAQVKAIEGEEVDVRILSPSMAAFEGTLRFSIKKISMSREDWP